MFNVGQNNTVVLQRGGRSMQHCSSALIGGGGESTLQRETLDLNECEVKCRLISVELIQLVKLMS